MLSLNHLRGKFVRFVALLALMAGLAGVATPGLAAAKPAAPAQLHATMDCGKGTGHTPMRRFPGANCCVANICAMTLALPAPPSNVAQPALPESEGYALRALHQPPSIVAAPIPHPPKPV